VSPSEAGADIPGGTDMAEATRDLYAGPPDEFTAGRDRLVRAAKDAGDRGLATALQSLKRPVVAAWAVNLLVREEAELLGQVLEIGDALRAAQEGLEGDALRELGRQRRELIASVVARARDLVGEHGGRLTAQAEQQVAATLQAALADPAAAQAVLTGLLVKPLESTGLGTVDLDDHVATAPTGRTSVPSAPRSKSGKTGTTGKGGIGKAEEERRQAQLREQAEERRRLKREAAQERVADAEQAVEEAEHARDHAREQHEEARAHVLHLEARIDELRRQLSDLESQAETACEEVEALEQQLTEADGEVDDVRDELQRARAALSDLG
jgi:hypothetical protein